MGLFDGLKKIVNSNQQNQMKQENDDSYKIYLKKVDQINSLENYYENLSNNELKSKTTEFRLRLSNGETLDDLLVDAFALIREASWRILQKRHYDVQLIGGMILHDNKLCEMGTGEGKTLVAILPLYLNGLTTEGAFLVTTNDYLAKRDGELMKQVLGGLGLTVGIVQSPDDEGTRRRAYAMDITYVSNQELGFDYLRDNLALSYNNIVQTKPYHYCIVDEADSILIDEARTPLIISRKGSINIQKYITAKELIKSCQLIINEHYIIDLKQVKVELTASGFRLLEKVLNKSLFDLKDPWAYYILNALKAKELFQLNKDYILLPDNAIGLIDSFTGRVLEGRRFSDGLQQSLEAKEGVPISGETQVVGKVTYQSLFKLFPKLSGMSGTALLSADELKEVYDLRVQAVPPALPLARRDNSDAIFRTENGKLKALLRNVLSTHEKNRPILIG